jgi:hypothetical protein
MERREKVNAVRELAVRSGRMISMDPERWGEHHLNVLESELQEFLAQLPEEVRDEYEDKYIGKYKEWLYAMSRCVSQMVTGAGGWTPAMLRRKQKNDQYEHNARVRLDEWAEKVIKRCNRQERLTGWAEVERLQEKMDTLTALQERMKAANKIIRNKKLADVEKVDELCALGYNEQQALKLFEPDFCGRIGYADYALRNNLATIKDTEAKIKRHTAMAERARGGDELHEYGWGKLVVAFADERYRFIFDGKPEQDVISLLKGNGFKWSPKNAAWQRQITVNAKYSVKRVIEKLNEMNNVA